MKTLNVLLALTLVLVIFFSYSYAETTYEVISGVVNVVDKKPVGKQALLASIDARIAALQAKITVLQARRAVIDALEE